MSRKKISEAKALAIQRMKELGFRVVEIARTLGVSRLTVYDHLHPDFYADRLSRSRDYTRRTMLGTGSTRENTVVLKHLNKRPYPGACEMCGKVKEKGLHYHHWETGNPSLGLWLCLRCHRLAELLDKLGSMKLAELLATYLRLKVDAAGEASVSKDTTVGKDGSKTAS